jgi:hypothetical protein
MAKNARRRQAPHQPPRVVPTNEFERWFESLGEERRAGVSAAIARIAAGGPTLGRPRADVIHGSKLHKLKEARVGRGIRLLFAFDSNQNLVMLLGGDKTGKWNRWYPQKIRLAERLYEDHDRSFGKEARWLAERDVGRTSSQITR